jgi:hypothetical protein
MAKAKLTLHSSTDQKKLKTAAHFSNVTLEKGVIVGDDMHLETTYKNPADLVKFGMLIKTVSGNELEAIASDAVPAPKEAMAVDTDKVNPVKPAKAIR